MSVKWVAMRVGNLGGGEVRSKVINFPCVETHIPTRRCS
jgi:hypothetical protein